MAPQAVAHRRGGTHRVKDEDKTNTIFDEYDYKQLKAECIERGVYVKDMKKVAMARALAKNEREKKEAERNARIERANREQQLAREKQREADRQLKENAARRRKQMEKQLRRDRDESVSDDTPNEDELQNMHKQMLADEIEYGQQGPVGRALSEESWDSSSTDTTFRSTEPLIVADCRLRLFEWTFLEMPSPVPRSSPLSFRQMNVESWPNSPTSPTGMLVRPPPIPRNVPYVPLKVHTIETREKLFLPGQTYPPGVDPDYVPVLSQQTRQALRNGILEGILRKATIERASTWTSRTQVQGWNARMFFFLPARNETKKLPEVYNKWYLENRRLLRVKPRSEGIKLDREQRHKQRHMNKLKKHAEVLEASEYRPTAVCYLPAYLDFDVKMSKKQRMQEEAERTLDNLFFIRFPGCDVPHYYFWARRGQWADPTVPNPDWTPAMAQEEDVNTEGSDSEDEKRVVEIHEEIKKRQPSTPTAVRKVFMRVKNDNAPPSPVASATQPTVSTIIDLITYELYTLGLSTTLSRYRTKWLANGKEQAWKDFGHALPLLYPSGELPDVPPLKGKGVIGLVLKIASIETVGAKTLLPPLTGEEPWTQMDDALWDVVEVEVDGASEEQKEEIDEDVEALHTRDLEALYRRSSVQAPSQLSSEDCAAWLEQISPSYEPLAPGSLSASPVQDYSEARGREEWDDVFMRQAQRGLDLVCPFCLDPLGAMSFEDQAAHMYSHSMVTLTHHRRTSSITYPPIASRPTVPRPSFHIATYNTATSDSGTDADTEQSPTLPRHKLHSHTKTRKRRVSQLSYHPPVTPSTHIPSPYLPTVTRYPPHHPNAAWRRRSTSSIDSLEFLDSHITTKRKTKAENLRVVVETGREDALGSPVRFYALERRESRVVDLGYRYAVGKSMKRGVSKKHDNSGDESVSPVRKKQKKVGIEGADERRCVVM